MQDDTGATAIEYGLVAAPIGMVLVAALPAIVSHFKAILTTDNLD